MIHVAVSKFLCVCNLRVTVVSCNWHVRRFLTALSLARKADVRNMCDALPVCCFVCSSCLLMQFVFVSCNMLPIWQHPCFNRPSCMRCLPDLSGPKHRFVTIDFCISSVFAFRVSSSWSYRQRLSVTSVWPGVLLYPRCMPMHCMGSAALSNCYYSSVLHVKHFCAT